MESLFYVLLCLLYGLLILGAFMLPEKPKDD